MNDKLKHGAQALAFSVLFLLYDFSTLLTPYGERRMVAPGPLTTLVFAHLAQIALIAVLYGSVLACLRSLPSWRITRWIAFAVTAFLLGSRLRLFLHTLPHAGPLLRWTMLLLLAAATAYAIRKSPPWINQIWTALSFAFACLGLFGMLVCVKLLHLAVWKPGPHQFAHAATTPEDPTRPRLVWVILDELDYYQTFGHRDASLQLPNFDRIRAQSTLFSDVPPVRKMTIEAVPSLLMGQVVTKTRFTWDNRMSVEWQGEQGWHPYQPEDTVFGVAHREGLRTSLTGWQIPYCTIFTNVVDSCYAANWDASFDGAPITPAEGFWHDFWAPLHHILVGFVHPGAARNAYLGPVTQDHERSVEDLQTHALDAIRNSHADFIYLHLPGAHPPNAVSRKTHRFAAPNSYLDAVAQADSVIGPIFDALQSQPRWQNTTVILEGDHGWRDWSGFWIFTLEDRAFWNASPKDSKPLVLIHHPGQTTPDTVSQQVNLLGVHDIALSVLHQAAR